MGLDAVVYRNKAQLELGADKEAAIVEPDTGEVYFESDALARKYSEQGRAVARRAIRLYLCELLLEAIFRVPHPFLLKRVRAGHTAQRAVLPRSIGLRFLTHPLHRKGCGTRKGTNTALLQVDRHGGPVERRRCGLVEQVHAYVAGEPFAGGRVVFGEDVRGF